MVPGRGGSSEAEYMPIMYKVLGLIPNPMGKKKKNEKSIVLFPAVHCRRKTDFLKSVRI